MEARLNADLFRYRFQSKAQAPRHLLVFDGRTSLFLRGADLRTEVGHSAMVELVFDDTDQTRLLRGSISSRVEGKGYWFESQDVALARQMAERGLPPRGHRRLGADLVVELRRPSGRQEIVRLLDVGKGGGHLAAAGSVLHSGASAELCLHAPDRKLATELGVVRIVWTDGGEGGFEFVRADPRADAVGKLVRWLEDSWAAAQETGHLVDCCQGGLVLDPSPPTRLRQLR